MTEEEQLALLLDENDPCSGEPASDEGDPVFDDDSDDSHLSGGIGTYRARSDGTYPFPRNAKQKELALNVMIHSMTNCLGQEEYDKEKADLILVGYYHFLLNEGNDPKYWREIQQFRFTFSKDDKDRLYAYLTKFYSHSKLKEIQQEMQKRNTGCAAAFIVIPLLMTII